MSPIRRVYRRVTVTERVVIYHNDGPPNEAATERFFADAKAVPTDVEIELDAPLLLTAGTTETKTEDGTNE